MTPLDSYPLLSSAARSDREKDHLASALDTVQVAVRDGMIWNTDYQHAKATLNNAVGRAWDDVQAVYLSVVETGRRYDSFASDLYYAGVSSTNDILSLSKKIKKAENAKSAFDGFINAARELEAECIGLAKSVRDLKKLVVKGRKPRPVEQQVPVNPDQVRGTCPCCFSTQAVRDGKMVHHGYQRPGEGFQTASCMGVRFKPFERSVKGTEAVIDNLSDRIALAEKDLNERETWTEITFRNTTKKIERGAAGWNTAFERKVEELTIKIEQLRHSREHFVRLKDEWKLAPLKKADGSVMPMDFEG